VKILKIAGIVLAVLIVLAIAIPFFIDANSFRPRLESELTSALGRQVKVGNLKLSLFSGSVEAENISIADDPKFSHNPFIRAKALRVGVEMMPLVFSKQLHVTGLTLQNPEITLLRTPSGTWNYSSIGSGSQKQATAQTKTGESSTDLSVKKLNINDGTLYFGNVPSKGKPHVYDKVNVEVTDFSLSSQFPVTASLGLPGGGKAKMEGRVGPIDPNDASLTPLQAKININRLDLAQSAFVDPAAGISGLADFDGKLASDGHIAKTSGTLKAEKLKLVAKGSPAGRPVQVVYSLDHDLQKESGVLKQGDVSMGKALAHLTGTYQMQGDATILNMKLAGQGMPVDDLEAMLPAMGVILPSGSQLKGGSLSTNLAMVGPADKLVTTGSIRLSDSRLANFNLGSKLSAITALSGKGSSGSDTSIQNLSTNLKSAPDGTRFDSMNLTIPALGVVTGAGTISPAGALSFKMNANLSGGAVSGVAQLAGIGGGKNLGVPFSITGTTSNPSFVPDVGGILSNQLGNQLKNAVPGDQGSALEGITGLFGKKKKPH
jgi:AsmA protein